MSKHVRFTTITPLPPRADRAAVVAVLHDFEAMIDLNPLVVARHRIPAPPAADPDEAACAWFRLTDALVPWVSSSSAAASTDSGPSPSKTISYTCAFLPLPDGLQTHCRAPLGVDIRDRWTVAGSPPGAPRRPALRELGLDALGAPATGLYVREDVDLRCNVLLAGFVKKTLKRAHAALAARLAGLAEGPAARGGGRAPSPLRNVLSPSPPSPPPPPPLPPKPPKPPVLDAVPPRRIRIGVHPQTLAEARAASPTVSSAVSPADGGYPFEPPPLGGLPPCAASAAAGTTNTRRSTSPPPSPTPSPLRLLPRTYRPPADDKNHHPNRRRRDQRKASAESIGSTGSAVAVPPLYPEMSPYADVDDSSSTMSGSSSSSYSDNGKHKHKTTHRHRPMVLFAELSDDEPGDSGTEPRMVVPVLLDTGRGRSF